ncbi:MAG: aspartyl-phosphate phosphatase Spo0E family protein [Turicibacter sp.]|nr:aspartyl-phosphate phosphatase Spo0E family protein [Turicibacter sp.]
MKANNCSTHTTPNETQMLYDRIIKVKAELHELVKNLGIVHELTVAKSQELDVVVNEYMTHKHQL